MDPARPPTAGGIEQTIEGEEMIFLKAMPAVFCMAFLGATISPSAKAYDLDHKTTLTFSGPIEIPPVYITGMRVLPAGTYVFKLVNSSSNRHIVQIFNKDQTKIYATVLAIPNYRLVAKTRTVITFNEGVRGAPQPIRAWFYPGANWGEEFVYPKSTGRRACRVRRPCPGPPGRCSPWKSQSPRNRSVSAPLGRLRQLSL